MGCSKTSGSDEYMKHMLSSGIQAKGGFAAPVD